MLAFQQQFIDLALSVEALRFGSFTLKSGRISPYFFNAGQFNSGLALAKLGACYADKIMASNIEFDMLFGPAYKGIPLVAVTAAALALNHNLDIPYAFNRKEAKSHGEGGSFVGSALQGKILIIDDVITAGTAIREVISMLKSHTEASVNGVIIGLDRKELSEGTLSAVAALQQEFSLEVQSIINIEHLMEYLSNNNNEQSTEQLKAMQHYWQQYGSK